MSRTGASVLPAVSKAPVTTALVALNVVVFIIDWIWPQLYQLFAFTPIVGYFEPWRLLTTTLLHGGFFHLLFNMLMLYVLGSTIERVLGWWKYLALYWLSALAGSMAIIAWVFVQPATINQVTIGASGAVYGLFGAVFVAQRRAGMSTASILILLVVNLIYGIVMPGISWQAHIGGFIGGLIVATTYVLVMDKIRDMKASTRMWLSLLATLVLVVAFGLGTWGLYLLLV